MYLSKFTQGRDNNFNLIRIIAAYAVLITHSFALAIGTADAEPFRYTLGMTMGNIAVDIFFLTSGFLVTASLLSKQSVIDFIWARFLRIFPALLTMLVLVVFGMGIFFTTDSLSSYLANSQTHKYFLKCLTLFTGVEYILPHVFENNPYKNAVNGSLWTMTQEVRMYGTLVIAWVFSGIMPKYRLLTFKYTIFVLGFSAVFIYLNIIDNSRFLKTISMVFNLKLFFMFFTGAIFFIFKDKIIVSHYAFLFFVVILVLSFFNKQAFPVVYLFVISYILFYVAYVPYGFIRKYNKLGDYSYGIYIYAFPIQQSIAALFPGISVFSMIITSTIITLILAFLSWHLLEKHALKLKNYFTHHTRRILFKE